MRFNCSAAINGSSSSSDCEPADTYNMVMGTVLFVVIWPLIVFEIPRFPLGRAGAALFGATLMVVFRVISQRDVYDVLGKEDNLKTIFLLIGMLLVNYYFDREGFFPILAKRIFGGGKPFYKILWQVCLFSGFLSALVTNDATCIVLTPILVGQHIQQRRSRKEILPLLLAIATSANIGSAATIFGNPQNAFIASATGINLLQAFATLLPAAVLGLLLNTAMLYVFCAVWWMGVAEMKRASATEPADEPRNPVAENPSTSDLLAEMHRSREDGPRLVSFTATQREETHHQAEMEASVPSPLTRARRSFYAEVLDQQQAVPAYSQHVRNTSRRRAYYTAPAARNYGAATKTEVEEHNFMQQDELTAVTSPAIVGATVASQELSSFNSSTNLLPAGEDDDTAAAVVVGEAWWRPRVFHIWLGTSFVFIIIFLSLPAIGIGHGNQIQFDLGLVPLAIAFFTMVVDALIRKKDAYFAITKVDWSLIVMFMGLFVWLEGFKETRFPRILFHKLHKYLQLCHIQNVLIFTLFIAIGSNVFSNVPLVILVVNQLNVLCNKDSSNCELVAGALLAWVSTISGNLTLFGSIANLIVAEKSKLKARNEEVDKESDYHLKFLDYLKFGVISTIVVTFAGLPIVYFAAANLP